MKYRMFNRLIRPQQSVLNSRNIDYRVETEVINGTMNFIKLYNRLCNIILLQVYQNDSQIGRLEIRPEIGVGIANVRYSFNTESHIKIVVFDVMENDKLETIVVV